MGKYTIDYFIDFFSKIPDEQWCVGCYYEQDERKCSLGHLGSNPTFHPEASLALIEFIY